MVITEWDWGTPTEYFHDEIATDRRNPTLNANGPVYGVHEVSTDTISVLDPVRNAASELPVPVRDPNTPFAAPQDMSEPSPYWGNDPIWNSKANVHSLMMDAKGRIWTAATIRPPETPAFCKEGSTNPSAMAFPLKESSRQATMYDPETRKFTMVDLCFGTQHLMFAEDANNTLWFSNPGGDVVGWLNTKMFDETHDEEKSQGWTAIVLDTNGNGKRDAYMEPGQPMDPTKDKRIKAGFYAVSPSPVDGSVWGTVTGYPGGIVRLNPGSNPPETTLAEFYEPPLKDPKNPNGWIQGIFSARDGYRPQRRDLDRFGQRTPCELRPAQMQRAFERPDGDGPAMSRRLDALSGSRTVVQRNRIGCRRFELLRLGRPVRHVRHGEKCADRHRQRVGLIAGSLPGYREIRGSARPLPDGLLREEPGWPNRRCQCRMEGQRLVVNLRHARAAAYRGRKGHDEQGREVPASARPAGTVI